MKTRNGAVIIPFLAPARSCQKPKPAARRLPPLRVISLINPPLPRHYYYSFPVHPREPLSSSTPPLWLSPRPRFLPPRPLRISPCRPEPDARTQARGGDPVLLPFPPVITPARRIAGDLLHLSRYSTARCLFVLSVCFGGARGLGSLRSTLPLAISPRRWIWLEASASAVVGFLASVELVHRGGGGDWCVVLWMGAEV